jgi:uncharacterized protein (TIGR00251 family)
MLFPGRSHARPKGPGKERMTAENLPPWVRHVGNGCWLLLVYVQPGAKKNAVAGEMDGRLRLRVAAQAVDNKANKALTAYIAELLQVRPSRVRLESGDASRKKTLAVCDLPEFDWNALCVSNVPS